ncbi:uncharacterized protein LOC103505282 [Diaphorina citri]|uniref:Uncharacterized protein LOC103505282 n=1 Tax=Diaphorina citri TaxID=121845 RepID=A0A3Q0IJR6_DIACI|nr:uncharacterized protein LOC103505282 [Diaphorina citri]
MHHFSSLFTDEDFSGTSSVQITEEESVSEDFGGLRDSSGRPLFGGLRALKSANMPEQPPTSQLKDLVEKHEKNAREATVIPELRRDKPKAKFRRSFLLDEEPEPEPVDVARSPSAPVSLKSLWLNQTEVKLGDKDTTSSSHSTVVSTRTSMKTDSSGKVSVTRDTVAGEYSVKDNEEPKGKLVKSEYKFNKAGAEDKGKSESKTTTAVLNAKNIKDSKISETFKLTDHNARNFIEHEKKAIKKTDSNSSFSAKENQEFATTERRTQKKSIESNANEKRFSKTDSSSSFSKESSDKRSSYRKTDSSASFTSKQGDFEDDIEAEVRRKPVVRGDSVRALQHKFQQATVSSSMKNAVPASNESKAVTTSTSQTSKTVNNSTSTGTTSTTTTTKSSTRVETFSTVQKGSSSYADSEDEDYQDAGSRFRNSALIEDDGFGNSSAALVSRIEKQRVVSRIERSEF